MIGKNENCITEVIGGLECHSPTIPPLHEIEGSHLPDVDQVWKRKPLPKYKASEIDIFSGIEFDAEDILDWPAVRREEFIGQTGRDPWDFDGKGDMRKIGGTDVDPHYLSPPIAEFIGQELDRTDPWEGGHWIMVEGKPVWLPPFYYFYLQWWRMDSGYPEYRSTDRKKFWYWQYCWEDMMSLGMTESDKRGGGKSSRVGCIQYLATVWQKDCHSPIQSKTGEDAKKFFLRKVVGPYKHLPDFLVPVNDNPTNPKKKLSFDAPSRGGKKKSMYIKQATEALSSYIDYSNAQAVAYDGATVKGVFVRDEEGKTEEADVWERHGITKECVYRDGRVLGKIFSTTTVAAFAKGGMEFQKLWNASNVKKRDALGFTKSGLYKLFIPAYETEFFDKYGNSVPDMPTMAQRDYLVKRYGTHASYGARHRQEVARAALEDDPEALMLEKLKNPWSEAEMFQQEGKNCQYNIRILRQQEAIVNDPDFDGTRRGNFVLSGGPGSPIKWEDNAETGMWDTSFLFSDEKDANRFEKRPRQRPGLFTGKEMEVSKFSYHPLNTGSFCGGYDPTQASDRDEKKNRSHAAGTIFRKHNLFDPERSNTWIADFLWLPDHWEHAWENFLLGCMYYGCQVLPELSLAKPTLMLEAMGMNSFIMNRPETTFQNMRAYRRSEKGLPPGQRINEAILQKKKVHIQTDGWKLIHKRIILDSIAFTPANRTAYDMEVASQLSLIATEKIEESTAQDGALEIEGFFNYG